MAFGFFDKLREGLKKTRTGITERVEKIIKLHQKLTDEFYDELEEILITSDMGIDTTLKIIDQIKTEARAKKLADAEAVRDLLKQKLYDILNNNEKYAETKAGPSVILVIGVNGVGKTTSIGKLAHMYKKDGKKVLLAAADTFRAAAIEQIEEWGNRVGVEVIKHQEGSDPSAVVFDAIQAAKSRNADILICDTAGRLHNKKNLMNELSKIERVITREYPEANKEVFLVLDATTGQNALQQALMFKETVDITGIILTKLDGTAKGGIVVAICSEMNIPVKYIGVGEGIDDLQPFSAEEFVDALFSA
ncbi:fused signal recognition particle receptor [Caldanaerobius fijiensis DSM 17918]|uniref:Signal recognition particle receptor FtsY n=1 Tax=Caldanaerobius fijiensis DSM 17918 TaxID=1121256 RepID=A0A1M5E6L9_9THEO|nr:signal recognition particle-docking protein FtsY [Caldanaerobius fijiensis]SHF74889.1 fused signal recognition particle receptor [Caldanaerobius fijiensis DSM 17918]